jgi:hypothetical protein
MLYYFEFSCCASDVQKSNKIVIGRASATGLGLLVAGCWFDSHIRCPWINAARASLEPLFHQKIEFDTHNRIGIFKPKVPIFSGALTKNEL